MKIHEYIAEEVSRQGYNIYNSTGLFRISYMLEAWAYMLEKREKEKSTFLIIKISDIELFGKLIEPLKNINGFRDCDVWVGNKPCPNSIGIVYLLEKLLTDQKSLEPLEFYRRFEEIHPFIDGNGRVGKILLNYKNDSLLNPIFPPNDFWGHPILNP